MIPADLQKLVGVFGSYDQVTPEAWTQFDADIAAYHKRRRVTRDVSSSVEPAGDDRRHQYSSWEECTACFAHGVFGYRRETLSRIGRPSDEPGELAWFCHSHMPARHFADARRDQ
jgi:hypothetical protein